MTDAAFHSSDMKSGDFLARLLGNGNLIQIRVEDGVITSCEAGSGLPREELWLAPGIFDPQVNGFGGVDFQQDGLTEKELLTATRKLRKCGCSRYLLTLITDDWRRLMDRLKHLSAIRRGSPELERSIAGWHIEGPFLSSKPGFHGAHNPAQMLDPTPAHILELREITGGEPLLLTIAPERNGALEAIALAQSLDIKISLGHTDASTQQLRTAVEAGATGFTHLGNGCPRELDRHDNIIFRGIELQDVTIGLIPDQIHVSPALFRILHKIRGDGSFYYTTDAMSAAGAPPGRYQLGKTEVEVGEDQIVRQPGRSNFAGSALKPIDGVFRAAKMLNRRWQDLWEGFSLRPARLVELPEDMENFCLLQVDPHGGFQELNMLALPAVLRGQFDQVAFGNGSVR